MPESRLVEFYRGHGLDHRGRTLTDIHGFDFDELEFHHDYIQWLFPLPEPSGANALAPLLTKDDIVAFDHDESLRGALLRSFRLMLAFYGLERVQRGTAEEIVRSASFAVRSRLWLTPGNHNFLRITRMLRSLSLLGLAGHASTFLDCLEGIYLEHAKIIGTTTVGYWRHAVGTTKARRHEGTNP